jgi:hypothetical protein
VVRGERPGRAAVRRVAALDGAVERQPVRRAHRVVLLGARALEVGRRREHRLAVAVGREVAQQAARTASGSCTSLAVSSSSVRRNTSSAWATTALPCSVYAWGAGAPDGPTSVLYSGRRSSRRAAMSSCAR